MNYYLAETDVREKYARSSRFNTLEEAKAHAHRELDDPNVSGPVRIYLVHSRTDKVEDIGLVARAEKVLGDGNSAVVQTEMNVCIG